MPPVRETRDIPARPVEPQPEAPQSTQLDGCAAMILAAGRATRLRPLTDGRAKAVVPFLNRPLLDYPLDWLRRCGFHRVVVNLHHRPASIRRHYGVRVRGLEILYHPEERLLGTGGGPRAALDLLDDTVLLVNGDVACSLPLGPLLQWHRDSGALATLGLHAGEAALHYPPIARDSEGRVLGFDAGDPAVGRACFTGIHLVERKALSLLPAGRPCGIVTTLYRRLLDEGLPVSCRVLPGPWHEVGTRERYIGEQLDSLRREDLPMALRGYRREGSGAWVAPDCDVRRAGVEGPYLLGSEVVLEDGALLRGVVAGAGVRVAAGARVVRSILLPGARIGAGARVEDAVVDTRIPPGTRVRGVIAAEVS